MLERDGNLIGKSLRSTMLLALPARKAAFFDGLGPTRVPLLLVVVDIGG
jgi:hypothetical protein